MQFLGFRSSGILIETGNGPSSKDQPIEMAESVEMDTPSAHEFAWTVKQGCRRA